MHRSLVMWVAVAGSVALIQSASAADMPAKVPSWTGFYIGANVGGGWGNRDVNYAANDVFSTTLFGLGGTPPPASFRTSGVLGGLQLGYNYQLNGNWLLGVETDFDWSGMKGSGSTSSVILGIAPITANIDEHINWFGTVRGRLGYLPADNLLAYVTGGFAYGQVARSGNYTTTFAGALIVGTAGGVSINCVGPGTCYSGSSSNTATGWTLGGGLEYALWNNLALKAEYLYASLDSKSLTESAVAVQTPGVAPSSFTAAYSHTSFNVARLGVNYRF